MRKQSWTGRVFKLCIATLVCGCKQMKNSRNRAQKWTAQRMDTLAQEVSKPLRHVLGRYKYQMPILHPFEATVADLTVKVPVLFLVCWRTKSSQQCK